MIEISASVIVSVYRSAPELSTVLFALAHQSRSDFEIIVSEDGESPEMAAIVEKWSPIFSSRLTHRTQPDIAFRKNRALNQAVSTSKSNILIFIDGDCVPSSRFVQAHIESLRNSQLAGGRRVELGKLWTARLLDDPSWSIKLSRREVFLALLPSLILDGAKNPEFGIRSAWLQKLSKKSHIDIVGCNFSCLKSVLEHINGFDERYLSPGLGEDSDVQERFKKIGVVPTSIKHLAPLYHLFHNRTYSVSQENLRIFKTLGETSDAFCLKGLKHYDDFQIRRDEASIREPLKPLNKKTGSSHK